MIIVHHDLWMNLTYVKARSISITVAFVGGECKNAIKWKTHAGNRKFDTIFMLVSGPALGAKCT